MRSEIADAFNILDTLESVIYSIKASLWMREKLKWTLSFKPNRNAEF